MKQLYILTFLLCFQLATFSADKVKLVILHTNDTHSQVEPSEKSSLATSDMGGYARRMGVIEKIRSEEKNVLLFDAGDYSQGSPYFNFFNGRIEIDALNRMKYDAVTMGNHEFDNGIDTLAAIIQNLRVPLISSNYDVTNSVIRDFVKPWIVIKKAGLKIGVMALNVNPESLILDSNIRDVNYLDPVAKAQEVSDYLKNKEKCDLIICLSHLGSDKDSKSVNDFEIAAKTKFIDVIIGGHSHSMLENIKTKNAEGRDVIIAQMAKSGFYLGRIDLQLSKK
ncbi:MAG: metallophosphoesterase [Paludibacteraceae bacterium]|nr:metallophosphoesterase [Paludibacteraceae bacterium]